MSEAPARRSPIVASAPWSLTGPWMDAWWGSSMSIRVPNRRSSVSHSSRSSKIASWTRDVPVAWDSSTHIGGWTSVASPG